jgi:hypothetical protein
MKVWVVTREPLCDYANHSVSGVFSSEKLAEEWVNNQVATRETLFDIKPFDITDKLTID